MKMVCAPGVESLAKAIQLSVSPVFLLAGLSGLLGVLTTRLSRIVDRLRLIRRDREATAVSHASDQLALDTETQLHRRRLRLAIRAITFATLSFICVTTLVMLLFLGVVMRLDLAPLVAALFILAMALLMTAVMLLVLEIRLGSRIAALF